VYIIYEPVRVPFLCPDFLKINLTDVTKLLIHYNNPNDKFPVY